MKNKKRNIILSAALLVFASSYAFASDSYKIHDTDSPVFQINVYNENEEAPVILDFQENPEDPSNPVPVYATSTYTLDSNSINSIKAAASDWLDILNIHTRTSPIILAIYTNDIYNASAYAPNLPYYLQTNTSTNNVIGAILIGKGALLDGWDTNPVYSSLYKGGTLPSLYSTISHELMHALGVATGANIYKYNQNDTVPDTNFYFSSGTDSPITAYDSFLEIYKGTPYNSNTSQIMDENLQVSASNGVQIKYTENGNGTFDIYNYAPYFTGAKTLKTLTGLSLNEIITAQGLTDYITPVYNSETNTYTYQYNNNTYTEVQMTNLLQPILQDWIYKNGGLKSYSYNGYGKTVYGLPVSSYEGNIPNLSHLELRNSLMSHQNFRNWSTPMEAELALLYDIGYTGIDTKKYFGKSVYLNNQNVSFNEGYTENTDKGVGLHIYGNNNNVIQLSDVISSGRGVIGARIEGTDNYYELSSGSKIKVTGDDAAGIGVSWGKNHVININEGAKVEASGNNGIGASFDFGTNMLGSAIEEKGSYSYSLGGKIDDDIWVGIFTNPDVETQGALVNSFNVSGTVSGKDKAIYISDNAFVNAVNILQGADIQGDIVSKWNSVRSGDYSLVSIPGGSTGYQFQTYPQLIEEYGYFTNLNFGSNDSPYEGTFKYNINGDSEFHLWDYINQSYSVNSYLFNTIKMKVNTGSKLTLDGSLFDGGSKIAVYSLTNNGTININNTVNLKTFSGSGSILGNTEINDKEGVKGTGTINIKKASVLKLDDSVRNVNSTVKIETDGTLSTVNNAITEHKITNLKTENNSKLSFEIDTDNGTIVNDKFTINSTEGSEGTAKFDSISVTLDSLDELIENGAQLFTTDKTVNMGDNTFSVYTDKKQHVFKQDSNNLQRLVYLSTFEAKGGLSDAAMDSSTGNYTVQKDEKQPAQGGYVNGSTFEITGEDLDFNSNKGLIIDGQYNTDKTTVKVSTKNAISNNEYKGTYTVQNNGNLVIETNGKNIDIAPAFNTNTNSQGSSIYISKDSSATINALNKNKIVISGKIQGEMQNNKISALYAKGNDITITGIDSTAVNQSAKINTLAGTSTNTDWQLNDGIMKVKNDKYLSSDGTNSVKFNGGTLNLQNNTASQINLAKMELNENTNVLVDLDFKNKTIDKFAFNNSDDVTKKDVKLNISDINYINVKDVKQDKYVIPVVGKSSKSEKLIGNISANLSDVLTPIYKYNVSYVEDENSGSLVFQTPYGKDSYKSYNPAVMAEPVAAQTGGYFNQLASYDTSFTNMDSMMNLPSSERLTVLERNKYAINSNEKLMYSPNLLGETKRGLWFKPYTTFEKVDLKGDAEINNIGYGTFAGGDTDVVELKRGWNGIFSAYAGYNGSHQTHSGISTYQNGGLLGLSGAFYRKNLFAGITANLGAGIANTESMYGKDDFTMLTTGAALKTGYNLEFKSGRYIVQPSYLMSYTFVNTFDYTNAAGLRISQSPLNAIQIVPGLKLIMNTESGFQPYLNCQMIWNILDKSKVHANDVELPSLSVKPYVQYGAGLQKRFGRRFSGYAQVMIRNGGRTGIALSVGSKWILGENL